MRRFYDWRLCWKRIDGGEYVGEEEMVGILEVLVELVFVVGVVSGYKSRVLVLGSIFERGFR